MIVEFMNVGKVIVDYFKELILNLVVNKTKWSKGSLPYLCKDHNI